jgi:hypothetical protein
MSMLSGSYLRTYIKIRKYAGRGWPEPSHGYYRYLYWRCRGATCTAANAANAAKSARLRQQRLQARERSRALGGQTVPSDRPDLG